MKRLFLVVVLALSLLATVALPVAAQGPWGPVIRGRVYWHECDNPAWFRASFDETIVGRDTGWDERFGPLEYRVDVIPLQDNGQPAPGVFFKINAGWKANTDGVRDLAVKPWFWNGYQTDCVYGGKWGVRLVLNDPTGTWVIDGAYLAKETVWGKVNKLTDKPLVVTLDPTGQIGYVEVTIGKYQWWATNVWWSVRKVDECL